MKYIKTYEQNINNNELEIGDYVICNTKSANKELQTFLYNNIGTITDIIWFDEQNSNVTVQYDNIPNNLKIGKNNWLNWTETNSAERKFDTLLLKYHSKNKEDLLLYIQANKFNL